VRIRVPPGPAPNAWLCTSTAHEVREELVPDATTAGGMWESTWRLPAPVHDAHLVVLAMGPGIATPHWPTAKPYQPTSTDFTPYVLGMSGTVCVDPDGSGRFESARACTRREGRRLRRPTAADEAEGM
jgi:hypothetical protein